MKQYHDILRSILEHGTEHEDRTGVGTISHFGYQARFDLREGFPIVTTKKVPFRWIAEELFWFLSGDTNEANLRVRGVNIWEEWADEEHTRRFGREPGDLGPIYGYLWRSFGGHYPKRDGVDQIARLIREIETNPNSRRLIVSGWDARECDRVDLPPCHTVFQFKVEQGKALPDRPTPAGLPGRGPRGRATAPLLHCQLYQRSADAFLGVPFNISSYALLTHLIAHVCGLDVGEFIYTLGDYHIYQNHVEQVNELLSREPLALPQLEIKDDRQVLRGLEGLLSIRYAHLNLVGYKSHGRIAAPVAI
ncbi:MAG TPA: thymidylate synthase [Pyrinomonadaceae bacterium]|nr:thymidylate synthase [Pyrinomonadaceae bacterium]